MKITSVRVRKSEKEDNRLKGFASVTLDDSFVINGIRIIEGDKGLFIAMPSRQSSTTGEYHDIVHPTNQETRDMFVEAILEEYNKPEEASEEE